MNRTNSLQTTTVVIRLLGIAAAAIAFWPDGAAAQITVAVPNLLVPVSASTQTGTFDISVITSGSSLPEVGDFTVDLQLSPVSGVQFTGGEATTANPYIFAGQSSGPTVETYNSGTGILGTDFASNPPTLVNGDGLLAVNYSIAANTSGTFALTLVTSGSNPPSTALDNQNAGPISFTVQNAILTVVPSTADLSFSGGGSNPNTTLGANLSIKGLTFTSAATQPVSINGNTLTIGSDGLTVQSGAAAATINSGVTLGSSQSWTISGSNPLTVNGTLSLAGQTLTKAGNGTLRVDAAPSLASGSAIAVSAGTVEFDAASGTASVGSNVIATVASGATLQLAGSVSAFSDGSAINPADGNLVNITNYGSTASGGGLLVTGTNQAVGVVSGQASTSGPTTYTGDTVVGNGTTAASLTATQILQNTLTIGAGSTVTLLPATSASSPSVLGNISIGSGSTTSGLSISSSAVSAAVSIAALTASSSTIAPSGSVATASVAAPTVSAVATVAPAAATSPPTPATAPSDPFLAVQSVVSAPSNSSATVAPAAATSAAAALEPVQAAIASVSTATATSASDGVGIGSSAISVVTPSTDTTSALATSAGLGGASPWSLVSLDGPSATGAGGIAVDIARFVDEDGDWHHFHALDGLAFANSGPASFASFGTESPAFGNPTAVPEPSSVLLMLLGGAIPPILVARKRRAAVSRRSTSNSNGRTVD